MQLQVHSREQCTQLMQVLGRCHRASMFFAMLALVPAVVLAACIALANVQRKAPSIYQAVVL